LTPYVCRKTTLTLEMVTESPIDDGHRWRKHGQKNITNSHCTRQVLIILIVITSEKTDISRVRLSAFIIVQTYVDYQRYFIKICA